jgi:hypothetical protein
MKITKRSQKMGVYIREIHDLGYTLQPDDLVQLRIHGLTRRDHRICGYPEEVRLWNGAR